MIIKRYSKNCKESSLESGTIITFGSCLSRRTANQFTYIFDGKIISSVYHNRSDAFVKRFINGELEEGNFNELIAIAYDSAQEDVDSKSSNILKNQFKDTLGLHRLVNGINFFDALETNPDYVFIDNYMDLAGKLVKNKLKPSQGGYFLKLHDFQINDDNYQLDDYLNVDEGIKYMSELINFILEKTLISKIIFLNFPYSTYIENKERQERTQEYEKKIISRWTAHDRVVIIPCLTINKKNQTHQKQHFKSTQYAAYAGICRALVASFVVS